MTGPRLAIACLLLIVGCRAGPGSAKHSAAEAAPNTQDIPSNSSAGAERESGTFVWVGPTPEELADAERRKEERRLKVAAAAAEAIAETERRRVKTARIRQERIAERIVKGKIIGSVSMSTDCLDISVRDHGGVDGDRVRLTFNDDVIAMNYKLTGVSRSFRVDLPRGPSFVVAKALNEGSSKPNTAQLMLRPCGGSKRTFTWKMKTGEINSVGVVRP